MCTCIRTCTCTCMYMNPPHAPSIGSKVICRHLSDNVMRKQSEQYDQFPCTRSNKLI